MWFWEFRWIGENENAKFWLSVMNDLKNRGVKDVYVCCVDGLNKSIPQDREKQVYIFLTSFK